ncbi:MAG: hypothetical protein M1838_001776 [Thelocarpon superellum]|nr:MAG: hypothetical protein M1838_001776 [Thelocarpon superellum]
MQKVLRRTALAKAQAARRAARSADKNASIARSIKREQDRVPQGEAYQDVRNARIARREDRELGPLAPRRDVGELKETYGSMSQRRVRGIEKPREERTRFWNIVVGDRVVLVDGRDKGKIGEVSAIYGKSEEVMVKGLNMVDVAVPSWMAKEDDPNRTPVQSIEAGIPLASVRLVHALTDPETGHKRDVIVKKLVRGNVWFDRHAGTQRWSRYIAGLDIKVPWPKKEAKTHKDHDVDTLRATVEASTWVPTLLRPPMPPTVIDELRNKYSKFRDRHDEDYVQRKRQEDEEARTKKSSVAMVTPLMEAKRRERQEKKKRGKPRLTPEMLERIGEVMASARGLPPPLPDTPVKEALAT